MKANKIILAAVLTSLALFISACDFSTFYMTKEVYETEPPALPEDLKSPAVLLFTKTNGFRHGSIEPGVESIKKLAKKNGWSVFHTENGAVFNQKDLARFDSTVWLSTSGDILNQQQKDDFKNWLSAGKGFVGVHGAGGDPKFEGQWTWFIDNIIGTLFIGHIMFPQFQDAKIVVEDRTHPATRNVPESWTHNEEWYSFDSNPRDKGFNILATVDESTYKPTFGLTDLAMGDHPIVWHHCLEKGRTFYTALGHQDAAYKDKHFLAMLEGAINWANFSEGNECSTPQGADSNAEDSAAVEGSDNENKEAATEAMSDKAS